MSARATVDEFRRLGGQASVKQVKERVPQASSRITRLLRQGVLERVGRGVYRLREAAK